MHFPGYPTSLSKLVIQWCLVISYPTVLMMFVYPSWTWLSSGLAEACNWPAATGGVCGPSKGWGRWNSLKAHEKWGLKHQTMGIWPANMGISYIFIYVCLHVGIKNCDFSPSRCTWVEQEMRDCLNECLLRKGQYSIMRYTDDTGTIWYNMIYPGILQYL